VVTSGDGQSVNVLVNVVGKVINDVNGIHVVTVVETLVKYVLVNDERIKVEVVNTEPPDVTVVGTLVNVTPVLVLVTIASVVRVVQMLLNRVVAVVCPVSVCVVTGGHCGNKVLVVTVINGLRVVQVDVTVSTISEVYEESIVAVEV